MKYSWCKTTPQVRLPQYIMGALFFAVGVSLGLVYCAAAFSKIAGFGKQGLLMGTFSFFGSLGRIAGPLIVTRMYNMAGPRWTFTFLDAFLLLSLLVIALSYHRIQSWERPQEQCADDEF